MFIVLSLFHASLTAIISLIFVSLNPFFMSLFPSPRCSFSTDAVCAIFLSFFLTITATSTLLSLFSQIMATFFFFSFFVFCDWTSGLSCSGTSHEESSKKKKKNSTFLNILPSSPLRQYFHLSLPHHESVCRLITSLMYSFYLFCKNRQPWRRFVFFASNYRTKDPWLSLFLSLNFKSMVEGGF